MSKSVFLSQKRLHLFMSVFFGLFLSLSGFSTRFYVAGAGLGSDTPGNGGQFNPLETVSFAISQAASGDTIIVLPSLANYQETNIIVNKRVRIFGNEAAGVPGVGQKPVFNGSGSAANEAVFVLQATNIEIRNFEIRVDQVNVTRGIFAAAGGFNGVLIADNRIVSTGTGSSTFNTYGIILGQNISNAGADSSLIIRNTIERETGANQFGRAIRLNGGYSTIGGTDPADGNTLTGTYGIQYGSAVGGTVRILNNTIFGTSAGIEFNNPTVAANHLIEGNTISPIAGLPGGVAMIEIKNHNKSGSVLTIRNNVLSGFPIFGIFSTKSSNVFVEGNTFTPADTARNFISLAVNTKQQTSSQTEAPSASSISITGNDFQSAGGFGGTAIAFQNHFSGANPPFQNVVIGGEGNQANTFGLLFAKICELDARTGPSTEFPIWNQTGYRVTQMRPVEVDFDLSKNRFDLGSGAKLPADMSNSELMSLEDRIQHQIDYDSLGFVTVIPNRIFVTSGSALPPFTQTPSINRGFSVVNSDAWTLTASPIVFAEDVQISNSLTLTSEPAGEISLSSLAMNGGGKSLDLVSNLLVNSSLSLTAGNIRTGSSNLSLASSSVLSGGSSASYIETSGSGQLIRKSLANTAFSFPIGTSAAFTPTAITNNGTADDIGLRVQSDVLDAGLSGQPVDSVVGITWVANEAVAGGSNLNITAQWPASAEKTGFNRAATFFQGFAGGAWVNLSGSAPVAASGSDPFTAAYSSISGDLVNLPLRISGTAETPPATSSKLYYVANGGDDNFTAEQAKNPATPWASIGKALASLDNGDSVQVRAGTYPERNLTFNKAIHLLGNVSGVGTGAGAGTGVKPLVNGISSTGERAIFVLQNPGTEIRNFEIHVDQDSILFGIKGPDPGFSGARISDNLILSRKTGTPSVFGTYGIILGQTTSNATNDSSIIVRNVIGPFSGAALFGRAIRLNGGSTVIGGTNPADGNTLTGDYGVQFGSPRGKASLILNNDISCISAGVEFNNPVIGGTHRISGNKIRPVTGRTAFSMIEVKNHNLASSTLEIDGNEFTGYMNLGVFSSKSKNVIVKNNIFTPADTAKNFISLAVNTKQQTSSQTEPASFSSITISGNQFKAGSSAGGTAIAFQNHFSGVTPPFQNVQVGGSGVLANQFDANHIRFFELDARSGSSKQFPLWNQASYRATTMLPVEVDFDLSGNQFDMGSGLKTPADLTVAERMLLEDKVQHQIDFDSLGFVTLVNNEAFVTNNSFLLPKTSVASLNRAVSAVDSDGWKITAAPATYDEALSVDSSITLASEPSGEISLNGISMQGSAKTLSLETNVKLSASLGLTGGFIDIGSSSLSLESSVVADAGSAASHVRTTGSGQLIRKALSGSFTYPIGTSLVFSPTTVDNSGTADDLGLRVQNDVLASGLSGEPVDSVVGITWVANEAVAGGSQLSITARWPGSSEKNGFNRNETFFQGFAGGAWLTLSGANPVAATGTDPFSATYTGISGDLVNLPLRVSSSGTTPPVLGGNLYYVSDQTGNDSRTADEAKDPATPWKTIGKALNSVSSGDSVQVLFGTYNESNLLADKAINLFGNVIGIGAGPGAGTGVRPVISGVVAGPDSAILRIASPNVLLRNFQLEVDQQNVVHGIFSGTGNYNNLRVLDCRILSAGAGSAPCVRFNSYGIRLLGGGTDSLVVRGTNIEPKNFATNCAFGRGIRMLSGGRLIAGGPADADSNRIVGLYGVQLGDLAGPSLIQNNTFFGQGIEITAPSANSGIHRVLNNRVLAVLPSFFTTLVEFKDIQADGTGILMEGNLVSGHRNIGVFSGRAKNVIIRNNQFVPSSAAGDTTFVHIYANTKQLTRATVQNPALNEITIQGNDFGSAAVAGGTAIQFANHNDDPAADPAFGTVVLGGADTDANRFGENLRAYLRLDQNSGASNTISPWQTLPPTTMAPVADDFDFSDNLFRISGTDKRPNEMDLNELLQVEDRIQHGIDFASLGFVKVIDQTAFVTENSFLSPLSNTASLQRAVNKADLGWTINIRNASIDEVVSVDKSLTWNTHPSDSILLGGIRMNGQGGVLLTLRDNFHVSDSLILNVQDGGKIRIGNNDLVLRSGAVATEGSDNSYVVTDSSGSLIIRNVLDQAVLFPVGTDGNYAPVGLDDANATGDEFRARVAAAATASDFTPALPPSINTFAQFQWTVCEQTPGGSLASLTFDWRSAANISGTAVLNALARNSGGNWQISGATLGTNQTATAGGISGFCTPFAIVASSDLELLTGNPVAADGDSLSFCPGDTISVVFTANGPFDGANQFTLVLSDSSGSFAAGGTIISTQPLIGFSSDTIIGVIPGAAPEGVNYRVRVEASSPDTVGIANTVNFRIFGLPAAPVITGDTSFCLGSSVNLVSSVSSGITWQPGGQTNDTISVSTAGIFTVRVTDANGCSASSLPFETSVNLPPVADTISYSGSLTRCAGNSIQLTANPSGFTYEWSNGQTGQTISSDTSGTFSVVLTNAFGCKDTSAVVSVNFNPLPVPVLASGVDTVCQPAVINLSTTSLFNSYTWLGTGAGPNPTTPTVQISNPGSYQVSVVVTDNNGCSDTSAVVNKAIFASPAATDITFTPSLTRCAGDTIILTANPDGFDYKWTTGNAADTLRNLSVTTSGPYSVILINQFGCTDTSAVVNALFNALPPTPLVSIANDTVCTPAALDFSTSASGTLIWSGTGIVPDPTGAAVTISIPGSYTVAVKVTDANNCSATSAAVNGLIRQSPAVPSIVSVGSGLTRCADDTLVLSASPFSASNVYNWSSVPSGEVIGGLLNLVSSGTYNVSLSVDSNFCTVSATAPVTAIINPLPVPVIATSESDNRVCQGQSVTLTSNFDTGNLWIGSGLGQSDKQIVVSNSVSSVVLQVTDGNGCVGQSAPVQVIVDPLPTVTMRKDSAYSFNDDVLLEAVNFSSNVSNFEWLKGSTSLGNSGSTPNFTTPAQTTATYKVIITDVNGCISSDSILVRVSDELFIPNSFSPNKDGKNDFFKVFGFGVQEIEFRIWDRLGNLIYESNDAEACVESGRDNESAKGWNGEYKGKVLQQGSFIWTVKGKFRSGQDLKVRGGNNSGSVILLN